MVLTSKDVLFIEVSSFQGVLIRGVPAVLFIEVSSFQGVLIRGVPAVLFIEVSSFQGVLIRGVPAVLFIEVSSFQGVLIRGVPTVHKSVFCILPISMQKRTGTCWIGQNSTRCVARNGCSRPYKMLSIMHALGTLW